MRASTDGSSTPSRLGRGLSLIVALHVLTADLSSARAQEPPAEPTAEAKSKAKGHFERGMALMQEEAWDAALAEFLRSRAIFASRGNTQNAALCLGKLHRFDEALDMLERLLTEFPNLGSDDRARVEDEIGKLRWRVGTLDVQILEPGATVIVDGRLRGQTPMAAPIRAAAGSHVVRVYKPGFVPFERRVELAGRQNQVVEGRLQPLTRSGRLKVSEATGQVADVVVDNVVVGKTPWEGALDPGEHAVALRGAGELGTQPATAVVRVDKATVITLALEPLRSELRLSAMPINAIVAIDGVSVGRGVWDGKVRSGEHRVEFAAEGFLPSRRTVSLADGQREVVRVTLERDPTSPLWRDPKLPAFTFDLHLGPALSPSLGGDVASGCAAPCSTGPALGGGGALHAGYQLSSGIGFALDVGYLFLQQTVRDRPTRLTPRGLPANPGVATDELALRGFLGGAAASLHLGSTWPLLLRAGGGVMLGTLRDARSGTFTTSATSTSYAVPTVAETPSFTAAYFAPEVRFGRRFGKHVEVSLVARAVVLFALTSPEWRDEQPVLAGRCDGGAAVEACEGEAVFGQESLAARTIVVVSPGLGMRLFF